MSGPGDGRKLKLRRCRRATPKEIGFDLVDAIESAVEDHEDNPQSNMWANWDEPTLEVQVSPHWKEGLETWARAHLVTTVYICEGDE